MASLQSCASGGFSKTEKPCHGFLKFSSHNAMRRDAVPVRPSPKQRSFIGMMRVLLRLLIQVVLGRMKGQLDSSARPILVDSYTVDRIEDL